MRYARGLEIPGGGKIYSAQQFSDRPLEKFVFIATPRQKFDGAIMQSNKNSETPFPIPIRFRKRPAFRLIHTEAVVRGNLMERFGWGGRKREVVQGGQHDSIFLSRP